MDAALCPTVDQSNPLIPVPLSHVRCCPRRYAEEIDGEVQQLTAKLETLHGPCVPRAACLALPHAPCKCYCSVQE